MNIGVIGTGIVGQSIAAKLSQLGHKVMVGTREIEKTLARTETDAMGNPPFRVWHAQHALVTLGTFAEAAAFGEMVFNCTSGSATIDALTMAGQRI